MAEIKRLLSLREAMKKRRPLFRRQEASWRQRLQKTGWRRPVGFHSKLRIRHKSKGARVAVGYKAPRLVRNLTVDGKIRVYVTNISELRLINKSTQVAIISKTVGSRKKIELLKEAKKLGVAVENILIDKYLQKIEENIKQRKDKKKQKKEKTKKGVKEEKKEEPKPEEPKAEAKPKSKKKKKEDKQ